jgi:hypothetical protein
MKGFARVVIIAGIVGVIFLLTQLAAKQPTTPQQPISSASPSGEQNVDFTASFTIVTGGVIRSFSAAMYHNLSPDAYIDSSNPTVVYVKKKGVTWDDFFQTLPFTLTKDCLTTGTKETFCTGQNGTLRFFLNDLENQNLLNEEISADDRALIRFST